MSAIAAPPPKPSSARPPIVPPTRTTYDGAPSPGEDSTQWLIRQATRLLADFRRRNSHDDMTRSKSGWRFLLDRWKQYVSQELTLVALVEEESMLPPPWLAGAIDLGPVAFERPELRSLSRLLDELQAAIGEIDREIAAQFPPSDPSEE